MVRPLSFLYGEDSMLTINRLGCLLLSKRCCYALRKLLGHPPRDMLFELRKWLLVDDISEGSGSLAVDYGCHESLTFNRCELEKTFQKLEQIHMPYIHNHGN